MSEDIRKNIGILLLPVLLSDLLFVYIFQEIQKNGNFKEISRERSCNVDLKMVNLVHLCSGNMELLFLISMLHIRI